MLSHMNQQAGGHAIPVGLAASSLQRASPLAAAALQTRRRLHRRSSQLPAPFPPSALPRRMTDASPSGSPVSTTKQRALPLQRVASKAELAAPPRSPSSSSSTSSSPDDPLRESASAADADASDAGPSDARAPGRLAAAAGAAGSRWDALPSRYKVLAGGFMSFVICNMVGCGWHGCDGL
jgi:hypothetical protein